MVNHVRTLLLNVDGPAAMPGDEYRDPSFRAIAQPDHLAAARAVLFGPSPDMRMRLYRTRQFMAVLHATRLESWVYADDPRVTYLPLTGRSWEFPVGLSTSPVGGHDWKIHVAGTPPREAGGRSSYSWSVAATTGGLVVEADDGTSTTTTLDYTGGWSAPLPLRGSSLTVSVEPGSPSGTAWLIGYAAAPSKDLGEVAAALELIGSERLDLILGRGGEPRYDEWRSYWEAATLPLPYRLGAFLLAVAARTGEAMGATT